MSDLEFIFCFDYDLTLVDRDNNLYPGVPELLHYIKSNYPKSKMCIVSLNSAAERFCREKELAEFFADYYCPRDDETVSISLLCSYNPKVSMIRRLSNVHSGTPILFDDNYDHIKACHHNEILAVHVKSGGLSKSHFNCLNNIRNIAETRKILRLLVRIESFINDVLRLNSKNVDINVDGLSRLALDNPKAAIAKLNEFHGIVTDFNK